MRRLLRDMRALAAELSMSGERDKADALLVMGVRVIHSEQPGEIEAIRAELLSWTLDAVLQDDLSGVLTQLRAYHHCLKG